MSDLEIVARKAKDPKEQEETQVRQEDPLEQVVEKEKTGATEGATATAESDKDTEKECKLLTDEGMKTHSKIVMQQNMAAGNEQVYGTGQTTKIDVENTYVLNDSEDVQKRLKIAHK